MLFKRWSKDGCEALSKMRNGALQGRLRAPSGPCSLLPLERLLASSATKHARPFGSQMAHGGDSRWRSTL
eukprot:6950371-Karenia_brevis.AAC.1